MIDLKDLSPAQRAELVSQIATEAGAAKQKRKADIAAYKGLVTSNIDSVFPYLLSQAKSLAMVKTDVYKMFETAFSLKAELHGVKEDGQNSHTFTNEDGTKKITLGVNVVDNYDDTADTGIAMINVYLDELSSSEDAAQAVKLCRSLLAKDKKGTLKSSRIMTLRKYAEESQNKKFIEGIEIIMDAYKPLPTKQYIKAEFKDEKGVWINVPLGMTEA